ncbi:MAG: trypsin-like serine peptidase [Streptosporangiaceae bacterium]
MRVSGTAGRRLAVASGAVLVASAALAAAGGSWAASRAAGSGGGTQTCITVDQLSATSGQQAATARYWTLARMRATAGWSPADAAPARLTPAQARAGQQAAPRASLTRQCSATRSLLAAVPAIPAARAAPSSAGAAPQSTHVISGYRTVGKLFYVTSTGRRASCTGTSISNGHGADLVLTAAHCVAGSISAPTHGWAFAPGWHNGTDPYGLWTGVSVRVDDSDWFTDCGPAGTSPACHTNPPYDYAIVIVRPRDGRSLASRVGADGWAVDQRATIYAMIVGIPYDSDSTLVTAGPAHLIVESEHRYRWAWTPSFSDGTSGGPWFYSYSASRQLGDILGDIGGYQYGGLHPSPSYSPYWRAPFAALVKGS